jgi:glutathione S-transferase
MSAITLYGTVTSPYVRRVRIVAHELGLPFTLVDTATDEGQARLRQVSPIWKVPVAELSPGQLVFDSHSIIERLVAEHGHGPLRPVVHARRWEESNLHHAIDGALDSAINAFYLRKDGLDPAQVPYLAKQTLRVRSALDWVQAQLQGAYFGGGADTALGLTEIALFTALDWMVFRNVYPVADSPGLAAFREHHADRPGFASTRPH